FLSCLAVYRVLHSFPTRRSSDLLGLAEGASVIALMPGSRNGELRKLGLLFLQTAAWCLQQRPDLKFILPCANSDRRQQMEAILADRKSTRLNSSHVKISYAVFCL